MDEASRENCNEPAGHWLHICQLKKQGRQQEIEELTEAAKFTCLNCNAVARYAKNLCNPQRLRKEPAAPAKKPG